MSSDRGFWRVPNSAAAKPLPEANPTTTIATTTEGGTAMHRVDEGSGVEEESRPLAWSIV
jgi:hypothetical protein